MATQGSANNLGRDDVGMIAPGMAADIVAWRTDTLTFAGPPHAQYCSVIQTQCARGWNMFHDPTWGALRGHFGVKWGLNWGQTGEISGVFLTMLGSE